MQSILSFNDMTAHLRSLNRRFLLSVVCGSDDNTVAAVLRAVEEGFAEAFFVGDCQQIAQHPAVKRHGAEGLHYVEASTPEDAARIAVQMVREQRADVLMKGLVHTDALLRAVLNKQWGILPLGQTLTHIAVADMPTYGKLLFFTDAAVIPYPTAEQRAQQVEYLARMLHAFGIRVPRISLVHCTETASEKFPHTLTYADLSQRAKQGEWGELIVDGPLDLRTSCDAVAMRVKGIRSEIEGRADALVLPDIESANVLYKALPFFAHARIAGTLQGTLAPVVLSSRGDDAEAKFHSLALATMSC